MQIEQDTDDVHEHHAQQAIAQVPQITRPDAFGTTTIGQLSKDGIDAIAHPSQHGTPTVSRLRTGFTERSLQDDADLSQGCLQGGQPVVAVAQQQPTGACRQIPDHLAFMHVGGSQVHLGNDSWPTQAQMQAKAVKRLAAGMIFAKASRVIEAVTAVGTRKLAHRDRHTIHDGNRGIIEQETVSDQTPQSLFDGPQVCRLVHKGRASHPRHFRKEMRVVAAEVVKDFLILGKYQIGSYQFHRDDLAISQFGHRSSFAQAFAFRHGWHHLVNQHKTCDNQIVQVHDRSPHRFANRLRIGDFMSLFFRKNTCTSGKLINADLHCALLTYAVLDSSNLDGANLEGADLFSTAFGDVDLSIVKGLEMVKHSGPSTIGVDTIYHSHGKIPEVFLKGAGIPDSFLDYMLSLVNSPIDYYSCFISYSSKDEALAKRLYADLQSNHVRCWFAPEDLKIGAKIRTSIDESIRLHDKLLLILSQYSLASQWIEQEVERALARERKEDKVIIYPIRLDQTVMDIEEGWPALIRNTRHIGDFTRWKRHDAYQKALTRLLRDLQSTS